MYSSIIRTDGSRIVTDRYDSQPARISQSGRVVRTSQRYLDTSNVPEERISRVFDSRIIDTTAPYTSRVAYGGSRVVDGRVSERRDSENRIRTYRTSNYGRTYDDVYVPKDRIIRSVMRPSNSYYTYENGSRVIRRDDVYTNRITPYVETRVSTAEPITYTARRSFRDEGRYKSRISLEDWNSYKSVLPETVSYRSNIDNSVVLGSHRDIRPVSYIDNRYPETRYEDLNGYTTSRVYTDYDTPSITRASRIIRPSETYVSRYIS